MKWARYNTWLETQRQSQEPHNEEPRRAPPAERKPQTPRMMWQRQLGIVIQEVDMARARAVRLSEQREELVINIEVLDQHETACWAALPSLEDLDDRAAAVVERLVAMVAAVEDPARDRPAPVKVGRELKKELRRARGEARTRRDNRVELERQLAEMGPRLEERRAALEETRKLEEAAAREIEALEEREEWLRERLEHVGQN